jgi:hypothetical protein
MNNWNMVLQIEKEGNGQSFPVIQRRAGLQARAEELRAQMRDSQLNNFRAETRNR